MEMKIDSAVDILTKTLWAEARGEGHEGMVAVGWVIRNRAAQPGWWGKCIESVCLKPYQFSCWNADDPNAAYLRGSKVIPAREYALAHAAAVEALEGNTDPTLGATHYYSTSMRKPPKWAASGEKTTQIGRHIFFKDVR